MLNPGTDGQERPRGAAMLTAAVFTYMKRPDIQLDLAGPTGDKERWTIQFVALKKRGSVTHYGDTIWEDRRILINSRLRNPVTIALTLLHEIVHATCGQNGSEYLAVNIEENYERACKALKQSPEAH